MKPLLLHQLHDGGGTDDQALVLSGGLWVPRDVVLGLTSADSSVTIADNGDGTLDLAAAAPTGGTPTYHGCSASRTTAQSISSSGTAVQFDAADEWDTDSIHNPATNNTRFTIPAGLGGFWQFVAMFAWSSSSNSRAIQFSKNGTTLSTLYRPAASTIVGATMRQTAVIDLVLAAGDYIEVLGIPSASQNVSEARLTCHLQGA